MAETKSEYFRRVLRYYSSALQAYLDHLGTNWQSGRERIGSDAPTAVSYNRYLATRAGVESDERILDAGCGVCGPGIDIAGCFPEVEIDAVTLGVGQVRVARELIRQAGFGDRIRVHAADFHHLPFQEQSFSLVMFLESNGYIYDPVLVFNEIYRVLRPGGRLYIKGVFLKEGVLSADEERERREVDATWAHHTLPLSTYVKAILSTGLTDVSTRELTDISFDHFGRAMFLPNSSDTLSSFGDLHDRDSQCPTTVIFYHEIKARKPG
jgi:SAM-dependent methyltransferase